MAAWRTARSITTLHAQLKAGAPRAAPPATKVTEWGTIGDAEHDPDSDHTPHDFPGWGNDIVTAGDFPNRPDLGLDAHKVLDDIRRSQDPRVKYAISNAQMFSSYPAHGYPAWTWRPYSGSDLHYGHGHMSVVGDARSDSERPWQTIGYTASAAPGEDDDMGQSFGPVQVLPAEQGPTSLAIPPVQGGIADPRRTWLNVGADLGTARAGLRIWASDGGGHWRPVDDATSKQGLHVLTNGVIFSVELNKGDRILSISRQPVDAGGAVVDDPAKAKAAGLTPYAGSISICFERS